MSPEKRKELGKLLKIAAPLALYYLTEVAMGLTNMIIVGRLGSAELAAVGLTANMLVAFVLVSFGILSMVSVLSSHSLGSGDRDAVARTVAQGFWVAGGLSLIAVGFGFGIPGIFKLTGQDPEVTRIAGDYVVCLLWFAPFALGFVVLRNFLVVLAKPLVVVYITVPALVLNLLLTYMLVLGGFGLPGLGVAGAGISTTLVNLLMFVSILIYVGIDRDCRAYPVFHSIRKIDLAICRSIIGLGVPAGVTAFLEGGLFVVVGILMGTLGADWLAANEILFHFLGMSFVIAAAIGEAAAVRIAFHAGARNPRLIQWNAISAVTLGSLVMLGSALLLWNFPHHIVGVFINIEAPNNALTVTIAVTLTGIAAVFQFFDGLQAVAGWALRGLKDTLVPMWIATCGYWLCGLGGGYTAGFVLGYGAEGIWWGMAAGLTVAAILLSTRLYLLMRQPRLNLRIAA
jgi:MATE family multidrug resistance protein